MADLRICMRRSILPLESCITSTTCMQTEAVSHSYQLVGSGHSKQCDRPYRHRKIQQAAISA